MRGTRFVRIFQLGSCSVLALAAVGSALGWAAEPWDPAAACTDPNCQVVAPVESFPLATWPLSGAGVAHYANSPSLTKFVDVLPGLCGPAGATPSPTGTASCIPVATPIADVGSDHYLLSMVRYQQKMHRDLPPTTLRGYVQTDGTTPLTTPTYLGPIIVAKRDTPVRLTVKNELPPGSMPIPVDETFMGSGMGPPIKADANAGTALAKPYGYDYCTVGEATQPLSPCQYGNFSHERSTVHLHGGFTPWISDGTPHQWFTPAGETSIYKKGVSFQNVPGMTNVPNLPDDGMGTYYYPNDQSSRLMFYHDHALGTTRLNVYSGMAAGYLLTDSVEQGLIKKRRQGGLAGLLGSVGLDLGTPLIIQDRSFFNPDPVNGTLISDPSWAFDGSNPGNPTATPTSGACGTDAIPNGRLPCSTAEGSLWFPHVYVPNQIIGGGMDDKGRWDYAPLFGPPAYAFNEKLPTVSSTPEAFMDTMAVNGTLYPYMEVQRRPMRFRILNASNDRFVNLQLYYAVNGDGSSWRNQLSGAPQQPQYGSKCNSTSKPYADCTEVPMVPAHGQLYSVPTYGAITPARPVWVPFDNRRGGVPDPRYQVPFIQIGTEGGFLPAPVVHTNQPIDWDYDNKSMTAFNVRNFPINDPERCAGCDFPKPGYSLLLGPAERADIIVDFGLIPEGSTLILYNDAPAAFPGRDSRYDIFTGSPDQRSANGGPLAGEKGKGPNTRTIMQFRVVGGQFTITEIPHENPRSFLRLSSTFMSSLPGALATAFAQSHADNANVPVDGPITPAGGTMYYKHTVDPPYFVDVNRYKCNDSDQSGCGYLNMCGFGRGCVAGSVVEYPRCEVFTVANGHVDNSQDPNYRKTCGFPVRTKTIMEDFEPIHGRLFALLGDEQTALEPNGQTTFGLRYQDPATEILHEGETEIWNIWHNGVDSHAVHVHLMNAQLINRIDWGGVVKLPDANERGFKETIVMNPLENVVMAVRVNKPKLPSWWGALPTSSRPYDVTTALGVTNPNALTTFPFLTNNTSNRIADFGWEYVWHCHLLGHEENDMMRPLVMKVDPPPAPPPPPVP